MTERQKILCIDDEPINLLILSKKLGKNYDVITAEDGRRALEILEKDASINLVISDLKMPGMSGLEFIREASHRFSNKRYYILSGYTFNRELQEAVESKLIHQYFPKPADFSEINKALVLEN